jgi:DNA-binding transcriptional ArsR family regulator
MRYRSGMTSWGFLTNHARVMLLIARDPDLRLRDLAGALGVTERTVQGLVADLTEAGYVVKEKDGRRNRYQIQPDLPLPHRLTRERTIGELLNLLLGSEGAAAQIGQPHEPPETPAKHHPSTPDAPSARTDGR